MKAATTVLGIGLIVAALYLATLTARETCTQINLSGFARTELIVTGYDEEASALTGRVAASGEVFSRISESFVGTELVQKLKKDGRLKGYRAPVWYLKRSDPWESIDRIMPFRLQSVDEFGARSYALLVGANLACAFLGIWLIRQANPG